MLLIGIKKKGGKYYMVKSKVIFSPPGKIFLSKDFSEALLVNLQTNINVHSSNFLGN
jgi:hypothetical protein